MIRTGGFGSLAPLRHSTEDVMQKSFSVIMAAAAAIVVVSSTAARAGDIYPFGDPPYRLDYVVEPQIESGCWKWNWQLYQYQDRCPAYIHPKAYMFSRSSRVVLRTKG
ncbi:hypothetical protein ACE103_15875 [Bradyrhizobium sp. ma5]|uniref:hypothetical protein n=1 Tax=Bradyrhizobium sp. ma5 TaxID=3344828 RepID=UPI0035D509B9